MTSLLEVIALFQVIINLIPTRLSQAQDQLGEDVLYILVILLDVTFTFKKWYFHSPQWIAPDNMLVQLMLP